MFWENLLNPGELEVSTHRYQPKSLWLLHMWSLRKTQKEREKFLKFLISLYSRMKQNMQISLFPWHWTAISSYFYFPKIASHMGLDPPEVTGRSAQQASFKQLSESWKTRELPVDWQLGNVTSIYKKCWKEDLGTYRPFSLTSCSISSWVPSCSMHRTTRASDPASRGLWRAGSVWPTWSPSMAKWPA